MNEPLNSVGGAESLLAAVEELAAFQILIKLLRRTFDNYDFMCLSQCTCHAIPLFYKKQETSLDRLSLSYRSIISLISKVTVIVSI